MTLPVASQSLSVATRAPTGQTNAYVLGREPALLVDPASRTDALDELVGERGVEHVLVTHSHPDHVGAVDAYAREYDLTVWARADFEDRLATAADVAPDRTVRDGTEIELGGGDARVVDAPGHAPDHVAVVAGADGPVCSGDCALADGSVVVGAPDGDMRAYLSSLRRLRALDPPRLLPGHGPTIDDPEATLDRLIDHRLERERRVLDAVSEGARTLEAILQGAYDKDLTGVEDLARATVAAHLEKLDADGGLAWDGDRARPHD